MDSCHSDTFILRIILSGVSSLYHTQRSNKYSLTRERSEVIASLDKRQTYYKMESYMLSLRQKYPATLCRQQYVEISSRLSCVFHNCLGLIYPDCTIKKT